MKNVSMFGPRIVRGGTLLAAGAGMAILCLWLTGVAWPHSDDISNTFCRGMEQWHAKQLAFQQRVNESGSRRDPGLEETYDAFEDAARVPLPVAASPAEDEIRELARSINRLQEEWLSQLAMVDATHDNTSLSVEYRLTLFTDADETRIEANDLLREASAALGQACSLPPLPIYD